MIRIGIIGAMEEETQNLIKDMKIERSLTKARMQFNSGELYGKNVVVVTCGIGKVNAAVCTQILIDDFNVDCVINVGIAGGIREDIYPGDVVVADNLVQHDMDTSFFGDKLGQIPRIEVYDFKCDEELVNIAKESCKELKDNNHFTGRIVSGDQFLADAKKMLWLSEEFSALGCEMEGASIAQTCYLNNKKFVVIRSISDNAINGTHMDYETFKEKAVINSNLILKNMLQQM